jgi:transposase
MRRYGPRDDPWDQIRDLLSGTGLGRDHRGGHRLFSEALLYRCRADIPWRDLPDRFGAWKNLHRRFSRWANEAAGKTAVIPSKANRKLHRVYDRHLYKEHHLIENFIARLKQFCAIATRYDKTACSCLPPFTSPPAPFGSIDDRLYLTLSKQLLLIELFARRHFNTACSLVPAYPAIRVVLACGRRAIQ